MNVKKYVIFAGITFLYIFLINWVAAINFDELTLQYLEVANGSKVVQTSGTTENLGVSESVSIGVLRKRFYGTIRETDGDSYLFLFNLIKLPMKVGGFVYTYIHLLFVVIMVIWNDRYTHKSMKGGVSNENLSQNWTVSTP